MASCWDKELCRPFDTYYNNDGQRSTNYNEWWKHRDLTLYTIPCLQSPRYEPFLVVRKGKYTPRYNEDFSGYGKNKVQYTRHLAQSGFKFATLPLAFIIHAPHAKSEYFEKWMESHHCGKGNSLCTDQLRLKNDKLLESMELELKNYFQETSRTPFCKGVSFVFYHISPGPKRSPRPRQLKVGA